MRYGIEDIGSSPVATALFVVGVTVAAFAVFVAPEFGLYGYDSPIGSSQWWLGLAVAGFAIVLTVAKQLR